MGDETKDLTKDLTDSEKLNLILAELGNIKSELADLRVWRAKVDAFIEDRSHETRPILELIYKEIADLRQDVKDLKVEMKLQHQDLWGQRKELVTLDERISALEQRPA